MKFSDHHKNKPKPNFDGAAGQYDDVFTHSNIGILQRKRVYHWLKKIDFFSSPKRIFEVNCGTGHDAEIFTNKGHRVVATDDSIEMIRQANSKKYSAIDFFQLSFDQVASHPKFKNSNALFSNFGGLNCIDHQELKTFVSDIAGKQSTGDQIIWVLMPKVCFMESLYFFFTLQFGKMFRRNSSFKTEVNVHGISIPTYYHSPKELKRMLKKDYNIKLVKPVAIFLPPSYMENSLKKRKGILQFLNGLESLFGWMSPLAAGSDHFIIIAKKR